jgi:hypothetical protein
LRGHQFKKIRIVRYEGLAYVLDPEEELIVPRPELHRTSEVLLIQPAICLRSSEFHAQGNDATPRAAPADGDCPRKTHINQSGRLCPLRQQPFEFNRAFLSSLHDADLLRTRQAFVARDPVEGVAKRAGVERGNGDWTVMLGPLLAAEFQAYRRIGTDLVTAPSTNSPEGRLFV